MYEIELTFHNGQLLGNDSAGCSELQGEGKTEFMKERAILVQSNRNKQIAFLQ
jgi:hypothetical protein